LIGLRLEEGYTFLAIYVNICTANANIFIVTTINPLTNIETKIKLCGEKSKSPISHYKIRIVFIVNRKVRIFQAVSRLVDMLLYSTK